VKKEVVLIDDEEHIRAASRQALELADIEVDSFANSDGALDRIGRSWPGVLVTDIKMPGTSGLEVMDKALALDPELPVILITGHGDVNMAVAAMRDGAYDFIEKPFSSDFLVETVNRALEKRHLALENQALRSVLGTESDIEHRLIGRTPGMVKLRDQIMNYALTDVDILIIGETGSGKELVAHSLHDYSNRSEGRFVAVNCGALPETLIESELFGHEAGSFTGATKKRIGRIYHAHQGTLFLDEVESMPMELQIKLLRVLQDRTIVPLGSNDEIEVDVRIIAATKVDLLEQANAGQFREDLYYRLDVLALGIPPLRERSEDIPFLFQHFVNQACERFKRAPLTVPPIKVLEILSHDWPGNVRELQNAALRYVLGVDALTDQNVDEQLPSLARQMESVEKQLIETSLAKHENSLKRTYEALQVSRKTLYDKIQKYGISVDKSDLSE